MTIDDSEAVDLWNAAVDAETGELLDAANWTSHGSPNPVIDGSSYRVFAFPKGDPNDGPRTIDANPADALASPFGWHDTNGVLGPEFTRTQGNNVHAYSDRDANNLLDPNSDADGGPTLTFDFLADIVNDQPAELRGRGRHEPLLLVQQRPRPHVPVRLRRGLGQLPGQQLRPRRGGRRRRSLRGPGRVRHEQRQLLHARERRRAPAHADVPLARPPVRAAECTDRRRSLGCGRHVPGQLRTVHAGTRPAPGSPAASSSWTTEPHR